VKEPAVSAAQKPRITFVDVLRLMALAQMINGHTLDAVMVDSLRSGPIFEQYNYMRGMVSVAFLMAAGFSYHLTTVARFDLYKKDPAIGQKRVKRALLLLFLGYFLQFRSGMFGSSETAARMLAYFWRVDVLHCIGAGLLMQEGIMRIARRKEHVPLLASGLACVLIALAPWGDAISAPGPYTFITNWLGSRGGSLFPILPWAAYILLGVSIAGIALPEGTRTKGAYPWPRLLALMGVAWGIRALLRAVPWTLNVADTAYGSRPEYVFAKLTSVLLAVAVLAFLMQRVSHLPKWMTTIAGETLVIYVFHLPVLFSFWWSPGRRFPHTLSLGEGLIVVAIMAVLCTSAGLLWSASEARRNAITGAIASRLRGLFSMRVGTPPGSP
jgi:uncharacterized membrane protein